jgi:acyl carrier protein
VALGLRAAPAARGRLCAPRHAPRAERRRDRLAAALAEDVDPSGTVGRKSPKSHTLIRIMRRHPMSTLGTLIDILVREYNVPRDKITAEATLATLGLDSLSLLELMFKIEDHYGVKIVDDTPTDLVTVNDVVRYIDGLIARKAESSEAAVPEAPTQ